MTKLENTFVPCAKDAVKISVKLVIESGVAVMPCISVVTSSGVLPSARAK